MAGHLDGGEVSVTGSAAALSSENIYCKQLDIRASPDNTGRVFCGKSNVTTLANRLALLDPGEVWTSGPLDTHLNLKEIFLVGTVPGDVVHFVYLA